ncbi:aminotransferase [Neomicrococcus lactis]
MEALAGLRRPNVTVPLAQTIAQQYFGVSAVEVTELGSNQDRNFLLMEASGNRTVLKIDNAAFALAEIEAQNEAMNACVSAGVSVAQVLRNADGSLVRTVFDADGVEHFARRFQFVPGTSLLDAHFLSAVMMQQVGSLTGEVSAALTKFTHPGLERASQWDMRRAADIADSLLGSIADGRRRERVRAAIKAARIALTQVGELPVQAVHGDVTDDNIMWGGPQNSSQLTVLDFGDVSTGWRVAELAVTLSSLLQHAAERPLDVLVAARAFHQKQALTSAEVSALWPLVVLRACVLVTSGAKQLELEADNDYAAERIEGEWRIFEEATRYPLDVMRAATRAALHVQITETETAADAAKAATSTKPAKESQVESGPFSFPKKKRFKALEGSLLQSPVALHRVDLGAESEWMDDGAWLREGAEEQFIREAFSFVGQPGESGIYLPYALERLTRSRINSAEAPKTIPFGIEAYFTQRTKVFAPFDGEISVPAPTLAERDEQQVVLTASDGSRLVLTGLVKLPQPGPVSAGDPLGRVASSDSQQLNRVRILWVSSRATSRIPFFGGDELAPAYEQLTIDPAPLLGLPREEERPDAAVEQDRRNRVFSSAQERYYVNPPEFERGWKHHLIDTNGRAYVDLVNNVAGLGHSHPRITAAAEQQLRLLNTNSRFLYRQLAEYSERLIEKAPNSLDTVLLVNSGTEAVDLALRLAWAATGRKTIISLREAYHGWSIGADAVTTSAYDNPNAVGSRPDWVHVADVPNPLRGKHTGPDAETYYATELADTLKQLDAQGKPVAGFICESVLGNAGGVLLPEGYLREVYAKVRGAGGLCIADEVQVGFGRMGQGFWGFNQQGVRPDIITIAKPMGNGFPIGGVITTRAIAESLGNEGMFFSSAGGSPLSCAVGLAVLDAMDEDKILENVANVGEYFKDRLEMLMAKHPLIGFVHGAGLYLGVELVRDRETLEPAKEETMEVCERMLHLGVIIQPTSERQNVLKIKPPLCIDRESVDFVVEALDQVLTEVVATFPPAHS